jgi:adenylate kinase family enzyme
VLKAHPNPSAFANVYYKASGKGTIVKMLQSEFGPIHGISTGELLARVAQQPGPSGQRMREFLASGSTIYTWQRANQSLIKFTA